MFLTRRSQNSKLSDSCEPGHSQAGFTLIEMVIGLVIGVIGLMIFSSGVLMTLNSAEFVKGSAARDELNMMIRRTILDRRALKVTINQNPVMKAVVNADYTGVFAKVYSNLEYGITLYDSNGTAVSGPAGDWMNPTGIPKYYTTEGFPCLDPGVGKCLISVKTTFMIQGIPKYYEFSDNNVIPIKEYPTWSLEIKPDFMQINYDIEYLPAPADSMNINRKPIQGAIFIGFDDLGN